MKTYKVLEAHQGDKFYMPGDADTGTRVADENAVAHLVTLGLLEEIGDAPDADPALDDAGASAVDLQAQIVALTQERDQARQELEALGIAHNGTQVDVTALREQLENVTAERDELRDAKAADLVDEPAPATTGSRKRSSN